jgi:hypothetical protein
MKPLKNTTILFATSRAQFSLTKFRIFPRKNSTSTFFLLEPGSLLLLALAFYFGLKRLASASLAANLNRRLIDTQDKAERCARILEHPESARDLSGQPIDVAAMEKLHQKLLDEWQKLDEPLSLVENKAKRYYRYRDKFLVAGFAAIFLAKVLQPYGNDASQKDQQAIHTKPLQSLTPIPTSQTNKPIQAQTTQIATPSQTTSTNR